MKPFPSSSALLPSPRPRVKPILLVFHLATFQRAVPQSPHPPKRGRYQPQTLPCSRFPQTYGPSLSGGRIRLRCRQTSVQTTTSGYGFTSTFATNTAIPQPCPRAWARSSPSSHPRTSRWARGAKPPLPSSSSSRQARNPAPPSLRSQQRRLATHAQPSTAIPQPSAKPCGPGLVPCGPQCRGRPSRHRRRRSSSDEFRTRPWPHASTDRLPRLPNRMAP